MYTPAEAITNSIKSSIMDKKKEQDGKNGYMAFYDGKSAEIYADTLYAAKVKAIDHFKAPKKKQHMISVVLAEKGGKAVEHVADF